jgi:hypothetical protein
MAWEAGLLTQPKPLTMLARSAAGPSLSEQRCGRPLDGRPQVVYIEPRLILCGSLLQLLHHFIHVEGRCLLPLRKILERR